MVVDLHIDYETWVKPIQSNFSRIELSIEEEALVYTTAHAIADKKKSESGYAVDNKSLIKRWMTGLGGEVALGKYLGVEIIDTNVGESSEFNIGDLSKIGLNIGVKSVEYKKFPLIHTRPTRPEIVLLKHPDRFTYMICGLYLPEIMRRYSSPELVLDPRVRESKTGFYGIPFYKSFSSIEDLINIK